MSSNLSLASRWCALWHDALRFPHGRKGLVLISDNDSTPGNFLICHYLHHLLWTCSQKKVGKVILVLAENNFAHYEQIAKRSGLNLEREMKEGRLAVIDAFSFPQADWLPPGALNEERLRSRVPLYSFTDEEHGKLDVLKRLAREIESAVGRDDADDDLIMEKWPLPVHVIVDSVSYLAVSCGSKTAVLRLTQHLRARGFGEHGGLLIVLAHTDILDDEKLINTLRHWSALSLELQPLSMGASNDVSGSLLIQRREPAEPSTTGPADQTESANAEPVFYHFKVSDSGAKIFIPGHHE